MNAKSIAVLIDADNVSADIVEGLFREIKKYGVPRTKRIYGDWTTTKLNKWKSCTTFYGIVTIQQFSYTTGKNSTDMAMVIDAMDLLHSGVYSAFCIVSSDSDFTRLASRIREGGLIVYGFGERKTPSSFRKACDKFVYTEEMKGKVTPNKNSQSSTKKINSAKQRQNQIKCDTTLMNTIREAIELYCDDRGWANLGAVGKYMNSALIDFDVESYGFNKLSEFIRFIDLFEVKKVQNQTKVRRIR